MEAARVKMCKLNEIMITRHNNKMSTSNNNNSISNIRTEMSPSTMIEEQEITDLYNPATSSDTQKLLF